MSGLFLLQNIWVYGILQAKEVSGLKKIFALIAALCIFLCACGTPAPAETTAPTTEAPTLPRAERIWDTWQVTIDCNKTCSDYILALMGQELASYFDFTGTTVNGILTLQEDGSFTFTITQEAVDAYTQQVETVMHTDLHDYLENLLIEKLNGRTLDEYLFATQVTMEELLVDAGVDLPLMTTALLSQLRVLPCSGTYFERDGMLHIAGTVCAYTLSDTTLQISAPEDPTELAPFPALFPLEFTR